MTTPTEHAAAVGRRVPLGALALTGGIGAVAVALAPEVLPIGGRGFGLYQATLGLCGLAVAAHGLELVSARGRDHLAALRTLTQARAAELARFGIVAVQAVMMALVARLFQMESPAFYQRIVPLAVVGFLTHHLLPARHRLPYFVVLSATGLVLVLGVGNAAWVLAIVGAFAAILHAPLRFGQRVALVALLGAGLAVFRAGGWASPWSVALWPVVGSMLMFRLIVFLYDQRHATEPIRPRETLAYLFLLPNVVFPLFPVVDFATFRRTYYDRDAYEIYQEGFRWIVRGFTHLLLYRIVYQYGVLAPSEVVTTGDLVQHLLATFGLYLRVSGQFHLIVGLLHLFGFRLPETHHLFYLASSFTDFWRRINIYWKDFMMKVVFYPLYFPLRKRRGETTALVAATLAVFVVTWLTHSYQWFWILGSWLLSPTDGLFWAILALLLVVNSLRELRRGRTRAVGAPARSVRASLGLGLRTAGTFATICLLWSLWGSESVGDWLSLLSVRPPTVAELGLIAAVLLTVGVAAVVADRRDRRAKAALVRGAAGWSFGRTAVATILGFAVLYAAGSPRIAALAGPRVQESVRELRFPELNARDAALLTRGYYENLTGVGQQNSQLWELYAQRPANTEDIWSSGVLRERDDFLAREMVPLFGIYQRGIAFRTNRWGMRDRDYPLEPGPNTYRLALLGQSYVAGDGVNDGETFEELVEDRLNAGRGAAAPRIEILNFAVGSYSILQQTLLLDRVFTFQPRVAIFVANPGDAYRASIHLIQQLARGVEPPFAFARAAIAQAELTPDMGETEALRRLRPFADALMAGAYAEFVAACRARDVEPVWLLLGTPDRRPDPEAAAQQRAQAQAAGFTTLDLSTVYDGHDPSTLRVSPWDFHPNAAGHRLIADRLYEILTADSVIAIPR